MLVAVTVGSSAPAAAQETSGEYREALNGLHAEMNSLTLEIERFRVNGRYCKPPQIPTKAEAQAELDALARQAEALNQRYNALKQSLKDFAKNPRVAAELMLRDIDPTDDRWFSSYEAARRRMQDALARKRAALAAAPEVDCRPKPKPQPAVTTGGFQPPPLPVRPTTDALTAPALPSHFCSWDEYWKFINEVINPIYNKAAEDAERVARFRTEVEQAVNSYVQNDRPVPPELVARRRQAIADVQAADRRMRETEELRNRAKAIPVIDCRQPQQQEPPRQDMRTGQVPTTPQQGLNPEDQWAITRQQGTIAEIEQALAELREFQRQGNCGAAWDLAEDLADRLDELGPDPEGMIRIGVIIPKPVLPPGQLDQWWDELEAIMDDCPDPTRLNIAAGVILAVHNQLRAEVGVPALGWDFRLSAKADNYATELARTGQLAHSSRVGRGTERENLNTGMIGWDTRQMLQNWVNEKKYFYAGLYPNVTTTGRWQDVSHYTQMIWPTTLKIGCGMATGSGYQWLVCYYDPGGNKDGKFVGGGPTMPNPRHVVGSTPPAAQPRAGSGQQPVANQGDIAPTTSTAPPGDLGFDPRTLQRMKVGGGMTQLDPPAPPPPTARDDAPGGKEENHPLVRYFNEALGRHSTAVDCGDRFTPGIELSRMRYAIDELKKRLKAAQEAGPFSSVKPEDVQKQIDDLEQKLRAAQQRRATEACPMPQPRGMVTQ